MLCGSIENEMASHIVMNGFFITGIITTVTFIFLYLVFKGWKTETIEEYSTMEFTLKQKKTMSLIAVILLLSLVPAFLNT